MYWGTRTGSTRGSPVTVLCNLPSLMSVSMLSSDAKIIKPVVPWCSFAMCGASMICSIANIKWATDLFFSVAPTTCKCSSWSGSKWFVCQKVKKVNCLKLKTSQWVLQDTFLALTMSLLSRPISGAGVIWDSCVRNEANLGSRSTWKVAQVRIPTGVWRKTGVQLILLNSSAVKEEGLLSAFPPTRFGGKNNTNCVATSKSHPVLNGDISVTQLVDCTWSLSLLSEGVRWGWVAGPHRRRGALSSGVSWGRITRPDAR